MTTQEAQEFLSRYAAFEWLTKNPGPRKPVWSVIEVASAMRESGLHPRASSELVRGWCDAGEFPGAQAMPGNVGWRIPREDLLQFFAERRDQRSRNDAVG
ncbi:MAG: helix-turn-helix domain-containing protein [Ktedonobacterales bacterium]|nr:helix-turn-helix domain-containing protein [Ktedonobacterales bacterium]